jgi:hypothetical protein
MEKRSRHVGDGRSNNIEDIGAGARRWLGYRSAGKESVDKINEGRVQVARALSSKREEKGSA